MSPAAAYIRSLGCVTPQGVGIEPLLAALEQQRPCPLVDPPDDAGRTELEVPRAGWIEPVARPRVWTTRRSPRKLRFARLDRLARLALVAAHHAVEEGGPPEVGDERAGLALGTAYGSHLSNERFQELLEREGRAGASPALFTYTLPSSATGEISIHLGLRGAATTLAQGEGAGLAAVAHAASQLEQGRAAWILAGGADVLSVTLLRALPEVPLAEGAAFVVLTTESASSLARVAGSAQTFGEGASRLALERAGVEEARLAARQRFDHRRPASLAASTLAACAGWSLAALPVLAICAHLARGGPLPALFEAVDPVQGTCDAVCLTDR